MLTVIETPTFKRLAERLWSEEERLAFIDWIACNPLAGDVIPGDDGARKVRWSCGSKGKRGGVRVIYFSLIEQGTVILVTLYAKSEQATIKPGDIPDGH
jgi:mRNA-degrading endonuclease RelE of RelBE toxin-antitoxin system